MKTHEISTPALTIEKFSFERNFAVMDESFSSMRVYPHDKSHKCLAIAKRQMESGVGGITCAKIPEVEDLVVPGHSSATVISNNAVAYLVNGDEGVDKIAITVRGEL